MNIASPIELTGYQLNEQIYTSSRTVIYKGKRCADDRPVIIKFLQVEYPTLSELVQFRNQYTIIKSLDFPGVIQAYSLENYRNGYALVMEDWGAISLRKLLNNRDRLSINLDLPDIIAIGIQLAEILHNLHQHHIIHKDIKPANILIKNLPGTSLQIKLIDFSISTLLAKETEQIQNPHALEGTLAYLSPEQTGRMNRGIDYRTDFYSLGVTLFELCTNRLPFIADDPVELVHAHIAKTPPLCHQINAAIPPIIAEIIAKLMAKNAEDRYQTGAGLKHDLEQCLSQLQTTGKIVPFKLAQRDISDRFLIPEKLYGRAQEVKKLLAAFDQVSNIRSDSSSPLMQAQLILIAGFSGIGKTAIVHEIHKPIVKKRGYFITGKFDQFNRNIPLSAFVQAFRELMRQLLSETDAQLQKWKNVISKALGENAQVIIDVIPELEQIIDSQPSLIELSGTTAQNRFNIAFQKFIQVFSKPAHPLVIFLDDLQWADSASLNLLKVLIANEETGAANAHYESSLLIIGAYRHHEVSLAHPLTIAIEEIEKTGATIQRITLSPLKLEDINQLVADTLNCSLTEALPLTELVYHKTEGNPFFTNQLLKSLYEDGVIKFVRKTNRKSDRPFGYWQFDLSQGQGENLTNDVVKFMVQQIQKLPKTTQAVIKLAACIGSQFDLNTLSIIVEQSETETALQLWPAIKEGLILPQNQSYKFCLNETILTNNEELSISNHNKTGELQYKFLHDRVQQAAYSLISDQEKQNLHLHIGQIILNSISPAQKEEKIFEIVNHLNTASTLISAPELRQELAQLNLDAALKAKASSAYQAALQYCQSAIALLDENSWSNNYYFTFKVHEQATETAYLATDFEAMEKWSKIILEQGQMLLEKMKVYEIKLQTYMVQAKQAQALELGLEVLNLWGINLPASPTALDVQTALAETAVVVAGKNVEDLHNLPDLTDPNKLALISFLCQMGSPAYQTSPNLFILISCQQTILSITEGNCLYSAYGYSCYGLILSGLLQQIELGYQFGLLAVKIQEKFKPIAFESQILYVFAGFIMYSQNHIKETLPILEKAYQFGIAHGTLQYAGYAAMHKSKYAYLSGQDLTQIGREISMKSQALAQLKQGNALRCNQMFEQAVINLSRPLENTNPWDLVGTAFNENIGLSQLLQGKDRRAIYYYYFHKMMLYYLFHQLEPALENANQALEYIDGVRSSFAVPVYYFYDSLICLGVAGRVAAPLDILLNRVRENQVKMEFFARYAPMNYQHKCELVEAEKQRILGNNYEASDWYDRAIKNAKANEYFNEEAIANELAAKFYLAWGREKIALSYIQEAYYAYARWGAKAKVDRLEIEYPQYVLIPTPAQSIAKDVTISATISSSGHKKRNTLSMALDFASLLKASQTIAQTVKLEELITGSLNIVLENAGAQRVILLLPQDDRWVIVATISVETRQNTCCLGSAQIFLDRLDEENELACRAILYYTIRTLETVVLNNASNENNPFINHPYIQKNQSKSILAFPLINQSKLVGVLYLENQTIVGAFTSERLETLRLLSTQIAISIENAHLYNQLEEYSHTLEQKVEERTAELATANQEITLLNQRLKAENVRMSAELDITRQLQQMILPKIEEINEIAGLEIAGFMEPAEEVGGDYYDILVQEDQVKIGIGDVTGHGLESGLLMIMAQTAVRTLLESKLTNPIQFLDILNRTLYKNVSRINSDKTMTLTLLDYSQGNLIISGQHEMVIIVRSNGDIELIDTINLGFPIALDDNIADFISQIQVQLNPGDGVVLYTDGITEAENLAKQQYGLERLCQIIKQAWPKSVKEICETVINDVRGHIDRQKVYDDITLVVLKQK